MEKDEMYDDYYTHVSISQELSLPFTAYGPIVGTSYAEAYVTVHKLYEAGKFEDCSKSAHALATAGHQDLRAHGHLVNSACYYKLSSFDASVASARQALLCNSRLAEAYYNLGSALKRKNNLTAAEESVRQCLCLSPNFIEAHFSLANILGRLGRWAEAEESYKRGIRLCPKIVLAYYNLSVIQLHLHKYSECGSTYHSIASALKSARDYERAIEYHKEACELHRDNWQYYYDYALTLQEVCICVII